MFYDAFPLLQDNNSGAAPPARATSPFLAAPSYLRPLVTLASYASPMPSPLVDDDAE